MKPFALPLLVIMLLLAVYLVNPLRTASDDLRIRLAGYTFYRYSSVSMNPTLQTGDVVFVTAWPYVFGDPKTGDIIAFQAPVQPPVPYLQRVVAVGGSTIEIANGVTLVDGKPLGEPYLVAEEVKREYSKTMAAIRVPPGQYFVLGDNRDRSSDSRMWGLLSRPAVIGRVVGH